MRKTCLESLILKSIQKSEIFKDLVDIELLETIESTAATVTRFTLYTKTAPYRLIYKDFHTNWIGGGNAELTWYTRFAPTLKPEISPTFYGGEIDRQTHHCHLLLDDLSITHHKFSDSAPIDKPQMQFLEKAIQTMLQLHIFWWDHPSLNDTSLTSPQGGPLRLAHATSSATIKNYVQALNEIFPKIIDDLGSAISPSTIKTYEKVIASWEQIFIKRTETKKNLTLIHGDFHIWNIFFPNHRQSDSSVIVDWETYKRGIGTYDLAYLLITCLDATTRFEIEKALLKKYFSGLVTGRISDYDWQDCVQDYRLAIIANLFPPLMWKRSEAIEQAITAYEAWQCQELLL